MSCKDKEKIWARYEEEASRRNMPHRQSLEWLGAQVAPRMLTVSRRMTADARTARNLQTRMLHDYSNMLWVKWLKFRWRIERGLIRQLAADLSARGVPRNVIEMALPLKGQYLTGWLRHGDPHHYRKRYEAKREAQIIDALKECPESRLFKGGSGTTPRQSKKKEYERIMKTIRETLMQDMRLANELKEFL